MRHRERGMLYPLPIYCGTRDYDFTYPYGNGPWTNPGTYTRTSYSGADMKTEEECWDELHPGPPFRSGGPLDIVKCRTDSDALKGHTTNLIDSSGMRRWNGGFLPSYPIESLLDCSTVADALASDYGDVFGYGATGWNKFRPTRPETDIGQFLGEIKEVPRMLSQTAKGFHDIWKSMGGSARLFAPKSVANHWLNTQFGWFPFLRDVSSFIKTTNELDKHMKQLARDNGSWIRRGGNVTKSEESEIVLNEPTTNGLWPALETQFYSGAPYGSRKATRKTSQTVWFEGKFRYWIPNIGDSPWNWRSLLKIYGLTPSPSLVWELTPWSWLVDWCTNVGDVIGNLTSMWLDNLAAQYAYVMGTTTQSVSYTGKANLLGGPVTGTWNCSIERKLRIPASPFGFGLTGDDFDPRQWSILLALGISRLSIK